MNRDFKGIWIPKEIWLSEDLSMTEKVLLVEIDSLDNESGCFASNEYFAKFLKISKDRVSRLISGLCKKGYLVSTMTYKEGSKEIDKRVLNTLIGYRRPIGENTNTLSVKEPNPPVENTGTPIGENTKDNNTSFNNTFNNTDYLSSSLSISNNQSNTYARGVEKEDDKNRLVFEFYQQNFGMLSPYLIQQLDYWIEDLNPEVVKLALEKSLMNNARNFNYTNKILNDWKSKNVKTVDDVRSLELEYNNKKPVKNQQKETEKINYGFKSTRY